MKTPEQHLAEAKEEVAKIYGYNRWSHVPHYQSYIQEAALLALTNQREEIKAAYQQYEFFMEGYRNGSASISEVKAANKDFIDLL